MRIATVEECRRIGELSQKEFGLSAEILMEAAGFGSAREIEQSFFPEFLSARIGVVCGPGNNGADGLVVARHLHSAGGRNLAVFIAAPPEKRSLLFSTQLERCRKQGLLIFDLLAEPRALGDLEGATLVVDALFGIGLRAGIAGPYKAIVEVINESRSPVVSLDTPSGLDADRGVALGAAVRATQTITFGLAKPGFFVSDGPAHVGRLRVLPIGFPQVLKRREAATHTVFTEKLARRYLPRRPSGSNKARHGHALLLAGSPGMWGAGLLSATAAYRTGCGYVTWAAAEEPLALLAQSPDLLTAKWDDEKLWDKPKWTAVGIGPGLGTGTTTYTLLKRLIDLGAESVVVDADAITVTQAKGMFPLPESWIITPHAGELSRVLGVESRKIESDRFGSASEAAARTGCHVLLKGFRTVISYKGRNTVILSGNSSLAKAGTGDVLTGMITGFLAQKLPVFEAAATAAYLHGRMADDWVKAGNDKRSLQASDLREILPGLLAQLEDRLP